MAREVESYHGHRPTGKVYRVVDLTEEFDDRGYPRYGFVLENVNDPSDRLHPYADRLDADGFVEITAMEVIAWLAS